CCRIVCRAFWSASGSLRSAILSRLCWTDSLVGRSAACSAPTERLSPSKIMAKHVRRVDIDTGRAGLKVGSLEEESGSRSTSFGESDAHFGNLVPFHDGNGPDGVVPLHLVADYRRTAHFLGNEAAQWH